MASPQGTRRCSERQAFEAQESAFPIDDFIGESSSPAPCHFVPSGEEVAHALIDVLVNTAEYRSTRPVAEVVRPAKQGPVQRVAHFRPRIVVTKHQQFADLRLEPLHALLGWARAQIPITVCFVTVRSERVPIRALQGYSIQLAGKCIVPPARVREPRKTEKSAYL